jgi:MYXO-CTERM domain-containing protein
VFAAIPDMTTVDKIMGLMQTDLTADPDFGAGNGNLGFSDVPLEDNGFQVFIRRTFVINDTLEIARAQAGVQAIMAASLAGGGNGGAGSSSAPVISSVVPEPASGLLCLFGIALLPRRRRR